MENRQNDTGKAVTNEKESTSLCVVEEPNKEKVVKQIKRLRRHWKIMDILGTIYHRLFGYTIWSFIAGVIFWPIVIRLAIYLVSIM